jgi:hypothetical protein
MAKIIRPASRTLTLIDGDIVGVAQLRATSQGSQLSFDVRADAPDRSGISRGVVTPVVYLVGESDPWTDGCLPVDGERVLVVGATRRRFFRSSGATVSRTEVEANTILLGSDRRRAKVLRDALSWAT